MNKDKFTNVCCDSCGKEFSRLKKDVRRTERLGRKTYCSLDCCKNKMESVSCDYCGEDFMRASKEVKRSNKLGRRQFCSRSCCGKATNNKATIEERIPKEKRANAWKHVKNRGRVTKESPFKCFLSRMMSHSRHYDVKVDVPYLMKLWEEQEGICPLTGWKLDLPHSTVGWKTPRSIKRASIDRIDNDKGYVKGNIRYISFMANIARNRFSDEELVEFCKAVVNHDS